MGRDTKKKNRSPVLQRRIGGASYKRRDEELAFQRLIDTALVALAVLERVE